MFIIYGFVFVQFDLKVPYYDKFSEVQQSRKTEWFCQETKYFVDRRPVPVLVSLVLHGCSTEVWNLDNYNYFLSPLLLHMDSTKI